MTLNAGLGGLTRHGCVALSDGGTLIGVCEQERVTRVKGAGFNSTGLPDEALDTLLNRTGHSRADIQRYVTAEPERERHGPPQVEAIDHHLGHACAAYLSSPFSSAAIVVCDRDGQKVSVWEGRGCEVTPVEWPWTGPGFADLYSRSAALLGFRGEAGGQRMEALARLRPDCQGGGFADAARLDVNRLIVESDWEQIVERTRQSGGHGAGVAHDAGLAAALQGRISQLFLEFLGEVRRRTDQDRVCLAGSLFYHSAINTGARCHSPFAEVFVPIDPGNAGLAVGTALYANGGLPHTASPFLGPAYTPREVKETLDNCKLCYAWETDDHAIEIAVDALVRGHLVGWFEGAMEWGPRALGARSILANPFSSFVLENLNRFLKRRESWRGYALSGLEDAVLEQFDGPRNAQFMECDYRPRDPARFSHVLPSPEAALRVHTAGPHTPPRFRRLLEAFGQSTGLPILVNTSFNGFHEPIVCSPRDAVRVFYGSGLDLLVLEQFVLRK